MTEELDPVFEDWDSRVMEIKKLFQEADRKCIEYRNLWEEHMNRAVAYKEVLDILKRDGGLSGRRHEMLAVSTGKER